MKEDFLHYIWQYQLFNKTELRSTTGEKIAIEKAGIYHQNSGPDFVDSIIKINDQLWAGTVEIHLKSSDWYVHNHENDPAYDNVILHVVWEDDMPVFRKNETVISTLELKGLVPHYLLNNYNQLFKNDKKWIACANNIGMIDSFTLTHWLERLYVERLYEKTQLIDDLLQKTQNDWETVLFVLLAKNFGLKLNAEAFYQMSLNLNTSILRKESVDLLNLEALFFGLSGLLNSDTNDAYEIELTKIFSYQKHKYNLKNPTIKAQYFRLRPPNFPSIRLSQLAFLWHKNQYLFQDLMQIKTLSDYYKILDSQTTEYWETHYIFGKENKKVVKKTTKSFIDLLLINTIIPLKFAYQNFIGKLDVEPLIEVLKQIAPEKNSVLDQYIKLKVNIENAMTSQALLTLKNEYCQPQKCLNCEIGLKILKNET